MAPVTGITRRSRDHAESASRSAAAREVHFSALAPQGIEIMSPSPNGTTPPDAAPPARRRLSWIGQLLVGLIMVAILFASVWLGVIFGLILGLKEAEPALNRPSKGVGMAPDLSGAVEGTVDVVLGYVGGLIGGLVVGLVLIWLAYRFVLRPLALKIPGLVKRQQGTASGAP
ncbi:MAG TPA: hypothetical protein VKE40_22595 [Gemmataceae bacterium]|nr:hypothetical protein [Gemmataceae bacterium]